MTLKDVLAELPALSPSERREILERIRQIEGEEEDIMLCNANAEMMGVWLDQLEAEDEARKRKEAANSPGAL